LNYTITTFYGNIFAEPDEEGVVEIEHMDVQNITVKQNSTISYIRTKILALLKAEELARKKLNGLELFSKFSVHLGDYSDDSKEYVENILLVAWDEDADRKPPLPIEWMVPVRQKSFKSKGTLQDGIKNIRENIKFKNDETCYFVKVW